MPKKKQTAAEIELQLSERRFILEAMNSTAAVLQVPIVTAFVWFYLSRTNAALGALNKAILAAELAPIVGDIKFPEGVLLGAAMESTEDFLAILEKAGLLNAEKIREAVEEQIEDSGDILANTFITLAKGPQTCEEANIELDRLFLLASGKMRGPEGVVDDPARQQWTGDKGALTVAYGVQLRSIKAKGCPRPKHPHNVSVETWLKV